MMYYHYDMWLIIQRNGQDVAAWYETKIELAYPNEANIMAMLHDTEYVERTYAQDGNTPIPTFCEEQVNGDWRIDSGGTVVIELRRVRRATAV
jgi:hypothetical protein